MSILLREHLTDAQSSVRSAIGFGLLFLTLMVGTLGAQSSFNVTMSRYNLSRLAANTSETILNQSNVNPTQFGKLWSYPVDGVIFGQPLYVQNLTVNGAVHNVLFVVTMNDLVYAFDADHNTAPLWTRDLRTGGATAAPSSWTPELGSYIGIMSTPVIDTPANSGSIFLVAQTLENNVWIYRLHKMSLTTGADVVTPTVVSAVAKGVTFNPQLENQRPGLVLVNGQIIICFSGRPYDDRPFHGWVMSYNATTLAQSGVFVTTSTDDGAGIWGSGGAPPADSSGNIYALTGNAFSSTIGYNGTTNFSETLLKMSVNSTNGSLGLLDWFTPYNWSDLDLQDEDLSCNAPMLIPNTDLIAFGSKTADVYVAHVGNLGHLQNNNVQLAAFFHVGQPVQPQFNDGDRLLGLAYWNGPNGATLFAWPAFDSLHSYSYNGTTFTQTGTNPLTGFGEPGMPISVSANGSQKGTGIVWGTMFSTSGRAVGQPGELHAFNAENLAHELWNTEDNSSRDSVGSPGKFVIPVVANGRVYMATSTNAVQVYGLLPSTPPTYSISGLVTSSAGTGMAGATVSITGSSKPTTTNSTGNFAFSGLVSGTYTVTPSASGYSFTPPSQTFSNISSNQVATFAASTISAGTPYAVSIDFVGTDTAMGASESAGVIAKTNWNNATGGASTAALSLLNETGAASGATATWRSDNVYSTPIVEGRGSVRMMKGYLDTGHGNATTVTVSGLPAASNGYDIYVYSDGNNGPTTRSGSYSLSGTGITTTTISATDAANRNFSGTFVQANGSAGNYVKFTINATAFTLTAVPGAASDNTPRAAVNGIQIIPSSSVSTTTYSISGQLTSSSGASMVGTTVSITGASTAATTTNSTGNYTFSGLASGTYTVTPSASGYSFTPTKQTFTNISSNQIANFTGSPVSSGTPYAIGIDFVGTDTAMGASESAGVIAKTNWNNATGAASTAALSLVNETGAASGATATWKSDNVYSTPIVDAPGNSRMMKGYLDTGHGDATTVSVSGLPADANGYDVYVYTDGSNGSATRSGSYSLSGTGITTTTISATDAANTNFNGTFLQANSSAGNYVKFTISVLAFTLTAVPGTASDNTPRAAVNGIQIIPH